MSINPTVLSALESLDVPVSFSVYRGVAATYITFFNYLEQGEFHGDDEEMNTGYYVQVDIWSKSDYAALADQVDAAMLAGGFKHIMNQDLYESDVKVFHKAMRFSYVSEP